MRFCLLLALWTLVTPLAAAALILAFLALPCLKDPTSGFDERRGTLSQVKETGRWDLGKTTLTELTLISTSGLEVDIAVRVPHEVETPHPLVLLLGGHRTGRDAVRLVDDTGGVVLAALSYPYHGDPDARGWAVIPLIPHMQQALLDTAPAVLLAMDYLLTETYVDPDRVELVGISLGAFLASIPGALDHRIRRVWLVQGAGNPAEVLTHRLRDHVSNVWLRRAAGHLVAFLSCSHYLRPERWVGRIAPRPVVVVSSRDDEALPPSSIEALHRSVGQPGEIVWMEGPHVNPDRARIVERIAALLLERITQDEAR